MRRLVVPVVAVLLFVSQAKALTLQPGWIDKACPHGLLARFWTLKGNRLPLVFHSPYLPSYGGTEGSYSIRVYRYKHRRAEIDSWPGAQTIFNRSSQPIRMRWHCR